MRPYVQVNTPTATATATTSTQSSTTTVNDTTTTLARPLHSDDDVITHHRTKSNNSNDVIVDDDDHSYIKRYSKRSYDDAKKAFLNYSPSDNYVYSNFPVNKSKLPSFTSLPQQQRTQALWSTHLPEPTQPKRCIDSTSTTTQTPATTTTTTTKEVVVLPTNNQHNYSSAEQSIVISEKNLSLSSSPVTSFDVAHSSLSPTSNKSKNNRLPFITTNANNKTIDECEGNLVKFVHCDNNFVDTRSLRVGAENEKNCGTNTSMLQNQTINDIQNCYADVVTPMSNSLNSSNCETRNQYQNSCNLEETAALLIESDPSKSITVRKAGNASLIFTKKESNPVVHRKKTVYLRTASSGGRFTSATPSGDSVVGDASPDKRHSFHWQESGGGVTPEDRKRKQVKSWYAIISSADSNEIVDENIEERYRNYNNLAGTKETNAKASHETAALLDQPQVHQSWRVGGKQQMAPTIRPSNINEMVSNGRETAKYNRFEQLLKNLVGRKVSRDAVAASATKMAASPTVSRQSSTISAETDAMTINHKSNGDIDAAKQSHLIFSSPEIQVTRTPSVTNLLRSDNHLLVDSASASTTSLNSAVQRKLWNVMPLLRREDSCTSLYQNSTKPLIHQHHKSGLKKCDTVLTLSHSQTTSNFEPIKAQNRLRHSQTIATCSRCSSILSLAANGSRYSLNLANGGGFIAINNSAAGSNAGCSDKVTLLNRGTSSAAISCKLCLCDANDENVTTIQQCGCKFCTDCMKAYVEFEIQEGAYDISCPDALCPGQGILSINKEISALVTSEFLERHKRFRLNREIELDKNRTWCPRAGCETVCVVGPKSTTEETGKIESQAIAITSLESIPVKCPTCVEEFCSSCKKSWHSNMTCEENNRRLAASGIDDSIGISFDTDLIKCCPMCGVPIEKDEGCAQMMCKRCKHVFCWYCLASLDDDFLLRHYDKGPCKNKLGHSRASVVWHRAQVIGIFAGFGLLLLVASPLLLLAAPCIVCCKCRICSSSTKLEDADADFDDANR